jgi:hypothetical protein
VQVTEPHNLLDNAITDFQNGVVARGQITVNQPGVEHTCIIGGGSSTGTTCSCTPAATCSQEATCFGALCDYSKVSLAPSTVYKVGATCSSQRLTEHRGRDAACSCVSSSSGAGCESNSSVVRSALCYFCN